jgi:metallophosphoesterase (TIGR00282 family)
VLRILAIGDIVGSAGERTVRELVPALRAERSIDVVIANGENMARGMGITPKNADALLGMGVDGITLGNHALRQREIAPYLGTSDLIVRPANLPLGAPGKGLMFVPAKVGGAEIEVAVINLIGHLYLPDAGASAFDTARALTETAKQCTPIVLIDMHAEATSEKVAMGIHMDGKASAVWGTHTHVQTSDARILPRGTGYITDLGMTGPHANTVIGVQSDVVLKKLTTGLGGRFVPGEEGCQLEGVLLDIDEISGKTQAIESIRVPLPA